MEILLHKEGVTKNGKAWVCAKFLFNDNNGVSHSEYFLIKPWNIQAFKDCLSQESEIKEKVQEIYG